MECLEAGREILKRLAKSGSEQRRRQAEWALLVEDQEAPEETAEGRELRRVFDQVVIPSGGGAGGGGRGVGGSARRRAEAPTVSVPLLVTLMLVGKLVLKLQRLFWRQALPLALPLLLLKR